MKKIRIRWAAAAVLATAMLAAGSAAGQTSAKESANVQGLKALKSAIVRDFAALPPAPTVRGGELEAIVAIGNRASEALGEVDNAISFVGLYEQMQCAPDRAAAKAVLINRIHLYRPLLEAQVDQIDESVALADLSETKQAAHKLQADLRAASAKLTAIEASLK
jgi:hypothetical protein